MYHNVKYVYLNIVLVRLIALPCNANPISGSGGFTEIRDKKNTKFLGSDISFYHKNDITTHLSVKFYMHGFLGQNMFLVQ